MKMRSVTPALAALVAVSGFVAWQSDGGGVVEASGAGIRSSAPVAAVKSAEAARLYLMPGDRLADSMVDDPFTPLQPARPPEARSAASSPAPPPKRVSSAAPPALAVSPMTPPAPPLPVPSLVVIGSIAGKDLEGGKTIAFIQHAGTLYTGGQGDLIAGTYKIVSVGPEALEVLHVPTNQKQIVSLSRP